MSDLSRLALEHQRKRTELSERVARRAARLWRSVQASDIDASWDRIAPALGQVVSAGQLQAARMAAGYTSAAARAQGVAGPGQIIPEAFTGATLEGREIVPELFAAATTTKRLIGRGVGVGSAFQAGTALMSILAATTVRDSGNMADKVSGLRRGRTVQYARMVSPGACSRCAILAGVGHFTKHFERHPECRCTTVPIYSDNPNAPLPEGLYGSPADYFESLSKAEQDRIYTKAGAEAIRMGADPVSVVNARRGMFRVQQPGRLVARATPRTLVAPDGRTFQAYVTTENRMRFGSQYRVDGSRRSSSVRLMPETIISMSEGDPVRAVELLRQFGYVP
ncbi:MULTISPECIES: VG15 protein [unclassified Microbacterium]|uniref:VG15 protein n=1 Tax=unclassified Microbacterium TaxID=2609290 RepID=UPI00300F94A1